MTQFEQICVPILNYSWSWWIKILHCKQWLQYPDVPYGIEVRRRAYFGVSVCIIAPAIWRLHYCLAKSRTFHNLALTFLELPRTKLILQDFPGPGNFTNTIPGLSRRRVNPNLACKKLNRLRCANSRPRWCVEGPVRFLNRGSRTER